MINTAVALVVEVAPSAPKSMLTRCRPRRQPTWAWIRNYSGVQPYLPRDTAAAPHPADDDPTVTMWEFLHGDRRTMPGTAQRLWTSIAGSSSIRRLKDVAVVVNLDDLAPAGGRAAGGRHWRRFEWFNQVRKNLADGPWDGVAALRPATLPPVHGREGGASQPSRARATQAGSPTTPACDQS